MIRIHIKNFPVISSLNSQLTECLSFNILSTTDLKTNPYFEMSWYPVIYAHVYDLSMTSTLQFKFLTYSQFITTNKIIN